MCILLVLLMVTSSRKIHECHRLFRSTKKLGDAKIVFGESRKRHLNVVTISKKAAFDLVILIQGPIDVCLY